MKDLRTISFFSAEQQSTDGIVSHMLMGFVERKISPQTIADVLRAQIFESQIPIHLLNSATCNGILEAVTLASSTEECTDLVLYLSAHPDFPNSLSFKAAVGALCVLLRDAQKKAEDYKKNLELNHKKLDYDDFLKQDFFNTDILNDVKDPKTSFLHHTKSMDILIEDISLSILNRFHSNPHEIDYEIKESLTNFIKTSNPVFTKLLRNSVHFQHLRFMLMAASEDLFGTAMQGMLPKPYDMILFLLKTFDEQLLKNDVSYYKTEPSEKNSSGRLKYLHSIMDSLQTSSSSDAKKTFLIEWFFEKALVEAVLNENTTQEFITSLKYVAENLSQQSCIMRGLFKAIQKDFSMIANIPAQKNMDSNPVLLQKANKFASSLFPVLVCLAEKDLNYVSKQIVNWALELPVQNEHFRFFKKNHWRWIRTLSAKIWDASLREPPSWVIDAGSLYCASIFHCAPSLWLQEYSVSLVERVYHETLVDRFIPTPEHFNYVEYLIRCVRKKSPFFASRTESLFALSLLSRLTSSEATQYENAKSRFQNLLPNFSSTQIQSSPEFTLWKKILEEEESFKNNLGNNPVTRALAVLTQLSMETARKG